ncbi:hypothetical protein ACIPSE_29635 [Streptomyces sp. NPDC090106]|uniref:hypothetical protein n=1 Tax=Streptomyces sp. NPDC090106 TaxID=3365946 RepID=UPI00382B2069
MCGLLIGGTSHCGRSSAARTVAGRLGWEHRSTDLLARHPGRPWPIPDRKVPPHVAEHYRTLTVDESTGSVLDHHTRLRPRVVELIAERVREDGPGLVLEGSALRPGNVAALSVPHTRAVWLTADEETLEARMRESARDAENRALVDEFLARSLRHQRLTVASVDALGLRRLDTSGLSLAEAVDAVLERPCRQVP